MVSSAFESHSWTVFWTSQLIILTIKFSSWQGQRYFGQGVDGVGTVTEYMKGNHWTAITGLVDVQKTIVFACVYPSLHGLRAEKIPETNFWSLRSHLSDAGARNQQLASCASPCQSWEPLERSGMISPNLYIYIYISDTQKDRTDSIYQYLVGLDFSIFSVIAISQFNCVHINHII